MFVKALIAVLSVAGAANALVARGDCNANDCLRAVRNTQRSSIASRDCTSALHTTVTPSATTITVYETESTTSTTTTDVTATETSTDTKTVAIESTTFVTYNPPLAKRTDFALPTYATACSGFPKFSSACSCIGVSTSTITLATPTVYETISETLSFTEVETTTVETATTTLTDATVTVAQTTVTPVSFRIRRFTAPNSLNQYITLDSFGNAVYATAADAPKYFHLDTSNGRLWSGNRLLKGMFSYGYPVFLFNFGLPSDLGTPYFCQLAASTNQINCKLGTDHRWVALGQFGYSGVSYLKFGSTESMTNEITIKAVNFL